MWGSHFQRISVHAYQAGRHSAGAIVESFYLIHKHKAGESSLGMVWAFETPKLAP